MSDKVECEHSWIRVTIWGETYMFCPKCKQRRNK